ncbi:MAG: IclR family transcriptional regulator [Deltaproteobacteria bacterium]|nr:IclR family transcriptional regulator [Deltaproteobacteria bacterium]
MRILELFSVGRPRWKLTEISRELKLTKSAAFRVVQTLEKEGYLRKDQNDKSYMLTAKILSLSSVVLSQFNIIDQSRRAVDWLWAKTQGTVVVRVLEGDQLISVLVRESPLALRVTHRVGTAYDFNFGAIGKAILAYFPEEELEKILKKSLPMKFTPKTIVSIPAFLEELRKVRRNGYALSDEEAIEGVRAVGAPIFDRTERPIAGISVGLPVVRFSRPQISEFGGLVRHAADRISRNLGCGRRLTTDK